MELLATVEAEWIKNIKPNSFLVHFNVLHFDLPFNFCFRICSTEKGNLIMTEDFKAPVRISFPFCSYICVCAIACACISKRIQLSIAMISNWFTLVYWKLMRHLKFTWCSFKKNLNTSLPTSRILQDSCINIHLCFIFVYTLSCDIKFNIIWGENTVWHWQNILRQTPKATMCNISLVFQPIYTKLGIWLYNHICNKMASANKANFQRYFW